MSVSRRTRRPLPTLIAAAVMMAATVLSACQETLQERCAREAREYTERKCPVAVGKDIIMDSMYFVPATNTICYSYTLHGELDDSTVFQNTNPRQLLLHDLRNATGMKLYKDAGYSMRYIYYSAKNKGTKLVDETFTKKDYQHKEAVPK